MGQSYKVFMTGSATQDIKGISSYIVNDLKEPSAARNLVEKIQDSIMSLAKLPLRYNLVSDENLSAQGLRKIMVDNYIIFYVVSEQGKSVTVVRILYGRRDWVHLL